MLLKIELSLEALDFIWRYLPAEYSCSNEELSCLDEIVQAFAPFIPEAEERK